MCPVGVSWGVSFGGGVSGRMPKCNPVDAFRVGLSGGRNPALRRSQAVRPRVLIPAFGGSNPSASEASRHSRTLEARIRFTRS